MLPDVLFTCRDGLVPPPCPPDLATLAQEYLSQLQDARQQGAESASLTVYQWSQSPWTPLAGAYAVLRAVVDFSYDHPSLRRLEVCCAGQQCLGTYRFQWNMWFAETKAPAETVTDL